MSAVRVTATLNAVYSWRSQYEQFARRGEPGLSYERNASPVTTPDGVRHENPVDCLLWRNKHGRLVGILYHYPEGGVETDGARLERPGAMNVWVKPECQRQGIATRLADEAARRWGLDLSVQRFTASGAAFANVWNAARENRPLD